MENCVIKGKWAPPLFIATIYTHLLERDSILAPPLFIEEVAAKQTEEFIAM